jgi:Fe-S cluster assembly protein SufD
MSAIVIENATEHFLAEYERQRAAVGSDEPMQEVELRRDAIARFQKLGVPALRHEDWKYTNLAPIARTPYTASQAPAASVDRTTVEAVFVNQSVGPRLVFVNGVYAQELSLLNDDAITSVHITPLAPKGASIADLPTDLLEHCAELSELPFASLNTAMTTCGAIIRLSKNVRCAEPIQLIFVSQTDTDPLVTFPRLTIIAEEGAEATIIENHLALPGAPTLSIAVTEVLAGDNSAITLERSTELAEGAIHLGAMAVDQRRDSRFSSSTISLGGAITRNDYRIALDGPGSDCQLRGLAALTGAEHVDNHLLVRHAAPNCTSREHFKNVLSDSSRGVFSGRIHVDQIAQKTDGVQINASLLLSDNARTESRPQLEIYADDVKCTHGATVGQIDSNAVFYLQTRGVSESDARAMLVRGFADEILDAIGVDTLRDRLKEKLFSQLAADPAGNTLA